MNNDILSVLQERATTFSKGQRAIARYITESYDKAAFMTASKLGRTVGVSESTVVRFAVELGYDGYPTMQKAMQEMVLNRLTSVQRIEVANDRIGDQDILSLVLQSDMEQLRKTVSSVDRKDFSAAVNAILDARRIYVLGVRSASALASFLGYYLNLMFEDVHTITASGTGQVLEKLISAEPDDVVIAFSYPRYSTSTVTGASFCHSKGAKIVAMTDSRTSPLGQTSDFVLQTKSDMASLVESLVAPLSVVNAWVVALAARREEKLAKTFSRLEEIWEKYQVYEKQDD